MLKSTRDKLINALLFQSCWFFAILSEWYFALSALLVLLIHLAFSIKLSKTETHPIPWARLTFIGCVGITLDSLLMNANVYGFDQSSEQIVDIMVPNWLLIIWFAFVFTLRSSLYWLLTKHYWFIISCTLLGPISYLAGRRFGAIQFDDISVLFIAIEWLVIGFLCVIVLRKNHPFSKWKARQRYVQN